MRVIGLTGSIGMGKSLTAQIFRDEGLSVHDSDETVHRLYAGPAVPSIEEAFPSAVVEGMVKRDRLSAIVLKDPEALHCLEQIIHPLVTQDRLAFIDEEKRKGALYAIVDIPLLFEKNLDTEVDICVCVTAPFSTQRTRVLARPEMTEEKFLTLLAHQLPEEEKCRRSHVVLHTNGAVHQLRQKIQGLLRSFAEV